MSKHEEANVLHEKINADLAPLVQQHPDIPAGVADIRVTKKNGRHLLTNNNQAEDTLLMVRSCYQCGTLWNTRTGIRDILDGLRLGEDADGTWVYQWSRCPICNGREYWASRLPPSFYAIGSTDLFSNSTEAICQGYYPLSGKALPAPPEAPAALAADFNEAYAVLTASPRAASALAQRAVQTILREQGNFPQGDIIDQINTAIHSNRLSTNLSYELHFVRYAIPAATQHVQRRSFGGETVEIEPLAALVCLELLQSLFEFYYVYAAKEAQRLTDAEARTRRPLRPLASNGKQSVQETSVPLDKRWVCVRFNDHSPSLLLGEFGQGVLKDGEKAYHGWSEFYIRFMEEYVEEWDMLDHEGKAVPLSRRTAQGKPLSSSNDSPLRDLPISFLRDVVIGITKALPQHFDTQMLEGVGSIF